MKNLLSLLAVTALLLTPALAGAQVVSPTSKAMGGGFDGPAVATTKVSEALTFGDDTPVLLVGTIQKKLGGELYSFTDGTGTIVVEIDDDDWMGQTVKATDKVSIWGEVDKEWNSVKVDVDKITKN